jgi:hypothetical protein
LTSEDIVGARVQHLDNLFKYNSRDSIDAILQVAYLFPSFINQVGNDHLMVEVTKDELLGVLHSFQKDKILGLYGLPIVFYLECFEFLGNDLLKVVEYSRDTRKILAAFNTNFIALILKSNNPHHLISSSLFLYATTYTRSSPR